MPLYAALTMYRLIFSNWKAALLFVGFVLFSVAALVGEEGGDAALTRIAEDARNLRAQREALEASGGDGHFTQVHPLEIPIRNSSPTPHPTSFMSEEELVDDASGIDPKPAIPEPALGEERQEEVEQPEGSIIIIRHGGE